MKPIWQTEFPLERFVVLTSKGHKVKVIDLITLKKSFYVDIGLGYNILKFHAHMLSTFFLRIFLVISENCQKKSRFSTLWASYEVRFCFYFTDHLTIINSTHMNFFNFFWCPEMCFLAVLRVYTYLALASTSKVKSMSNLNQTLS